MAAKYHVVPYSCGRHACALVVRESQESKLWEAIGAETAAGTFPPEVVQGRGGDVSFDDAIGVGSVQQAFATATQHGVTAPHLYRTTARGGLQPIAIGSTSAPAEFNPGRVRNSHDPDASTESMIARLQIGVDAIEHANKAKRANDLRAALGTAQWELGQAWTHGEYANLSAQDKGDVRAYLMELGMLVHEWIADDKRPTASQVKEAQAGAERLAEFVSGRSRAANPGTRPMYLVRFADGSYLGSPSPGERYTPRVRNRERAAVVSRSHAEAERIAAAHGGEVEIY